MTEEYKPLGFLSFLYDEFNLRPCRVPLLVGEPVTPLFELGGDGEWRELLGGGEAAAVCGQSIAQTQQGTDSVTPVYACSDSTHATAFMFIIADNEAIFMHVTPQGFFYMNSLWHYA